MTNHRINEAVDRFTDMLDSLTETCFEVKQVDAIRTAYIALYKLAGTFPTGDASIDEYGKSILATLSAGHDPMSKRIERILDGTLTPAPEQDMPPSHPDGPYLIFDKTETVFVLKREAVDKWITRGLLRPHDDHYHIEIKGGSFDDLLAIAEDFGNKKLPIMIKGVVLKTPTDAIRAMIHHIQDHV